ncbi:uncharacterized protein [Ambystoma mexicanum]|uniref:uncharacterized protein n=1 Tax=Ambystoma mexicanum TaxID=8296 RepID=UPI0037E8F628
METHLSMGSDKLRLAVIGAGAAGLCAARHILAQPDIFTTPVVYESSERVGGTWVYSEETGTNKDGLAIHSSMYRNMRTNLPKEVMAFPDYPFPTSLPSFMHHSGVLAYLEDYADHFRIKEHIQFRQLVEHVKPVPRPPAGAGDGATAWDVTVRCLGDQGARITQRFDAILVCNGHYFDPCIPPIPGVENFQGLLLHSHAYRHPEPFADKTVVVLGSGPSGIDIALEICSVAKLVILSHRSASLMGPLPANVFQAPSVLRFSPKSITFQDGSTQPADAFIFCTGYNYRFPFLWQDIGLQAGEASLPPLYKHLILPGTPSLFFIGLCTTVCPFILFYCQVRYCLAVLAGTCRLPSQSAMAVQADKEYRCHLATGQKPKYFLKLDTLQWEYFCWLAEKGGFQPVTPVIRKIYEAIKTYRMADLANYKNVNLRLLSDEDWEEVVVCVS